MTTPSHPTPPPAPKPPRPHTPADRFHLLVDCRAEEAQRRLYESLKSQGFPCRVLTL